MKIIVPNYYNRFACIKGACRHSCCVGWEIDIDEASLNRFRNLPGELGDRLRENIVETGEGASFRLDGEERCPFLNGEGLCDLILGLGEDCLCQICDDHPRFRSFFSDREEMGLGLCCEAAGRLILGSGEAVRLLVLEDDGCEEEVFEDEAELLELRDELISMAQDRSMPVESRIRRMLDFLQIELTPFAYGDWIDFLLGLERLEEGWAERLRGLACTEIRQNLDKFEIPFEQLLVYLLYRHLPGALEEDDLSGRIAYVFFAWQLVRTLCMAEEALDFEGMVEICRQYSSELEYSDENIAAIIGRLHEQNPKLCALQVIFRA